MASNLRLHPLEGRNTSWPGGTSPPPRYSLTEQRDDRLADQDELDSTIGDSENYGWRSRESTSHTDLWLRLCCFIGVSWTLGLYVAYPAPTTIPLFVGLAFIFTSWVITTWGRLSIDMLQRRESLATISAKVSRRFKVGLGLGTALVIYWIWISLFTGREARALLVKNDEDKYFIAVNLHNNESILSDFIKEMTLLIAKLGRRNVFLSIYESNSWDGTQTFLQTFNQSLSNLDIDHRILTVKNDPGAEWPYGTSPERIQFLAHARNMAMEPLQSSDDLIRLGNWQDFTKVIFLNDVQFRWQDIINLISTRVKGKEDQEYDLACAMDFGSSGLYDTWVARDICGAPLRTFWPFAHDQASQQAIRDEQPFEVASCWNGAVVFDARPVLYHSNSTLRPRGWKAVDGLPASGSRMSPPLTDPIHFRTSGVDACDHSECFLFSYDLHRLYKGKNAEGRPRILMNPAVRLAYEKTWYHWNNTVLRRPVIRWWVNIWSHGIGYKLFDWPFEHFGRRRDYCTWNGLDIPTADGRCRPLPGSKDRPWDE